MNFTVKGKFVSHNVQYRDKKDGSGQFIAGDAVFAIDNSYHYQGEDKVKIDNVPFNCFGKTAEKILELTTGEEMEITFCLEGTEYKDKQYPRIKAAFVHHPKEKASSAEAQAAKDGDVPF